MHVLLDECVPRKLRREITAQSVKTVQEMGWAGIKNGELLRRAATHFDVLLTTDHNIEHQQNMGTWCRNNRHKPILWQYRILTSKLRGHFQYFGIRCNMRAMEAVRYYVKCRWWYWLSRRSHKSAIPWEQFEKFLEDCPLPTPKIVHNV